MIRQVHQQEFVDGKIGDNRGRSAQGYLLHRIRIITKHPLVLVLQI
jgi:hypothetical protein